MHSQECAILVRGTESKPRRAEVGEMACPLHCQPPQSWEAPAPQGWNGSNPASAPRSCCAAPPQPKTKPPANASSCALRRQAATRWRARVAPRDAVAKWRGARMRTVPLSFAGICIFQGKGPFHTIYWGSFGLAWAPCGRNLLFPQ